MVMDGSFRGGGREAELVAWRTQPSRDCGGRAKVSSAEPVAESPSPQWGRCRRLSWGLEGRRRCFPLPWQGRVGSEGLAALPDCADVTSGSRAEPSRSWQQGQRHSLVCVY